MDDVGMRDLRPLPRTEDGAGEERGSGRRCALVVGIDDYGGVHPTLYHAVKDAEAVEGRLKRDFGFEVTPLKNQEATAEAIRGVLAQWQKESQPGDEVLFFFAGHGTQVQKASRDPEGFLIPFGAGQDVNDWLSEAELIKQAQKLSAQRVFLILDACYAGTAFRIGDGITAGARDDQVLKVLVAGTEDEPVLDGGAGDHSIFTNALLDGLDGLADSGREGDGIIQASELITYVRSEVPPRSLERHHAQTPVGGSVQGTRTGDDFPFRPNKPRLPSALLRNLRSRQAEDRHAAALQLPEMRGTEMADVAVAELLHLVRNDRVERGRALSGKDLVDVQVAAVQALGALGHPRGFPDLIQLVGGSGEHRLRLAAAPALGQLAQSAVSEGLSREEEPVAGAIGALVAALRDGDVQLQNAAKEGLGQVVAAAPVLADGLEKLAGVERKQRLDALAYVAMNYPDQDATWPALRGLGSRLWRRVYLGWHRLQPDQAVVLLQAATVLIAGAIGLGLAYVPVVLAAFWRDVGVYLLAVMAISAPAGGAAGAAFALGPQLGWSVSRKPGPRPQALGGLVAGLIAGLAMVVPNWFLHIGCNAAGCGRYAVLWWLLPGLVVGPVLALTLLGVSGKQARGLRHRWRGWIAVALAGGLALAVMRIPPPLTTGRVTPPAAEVALWAVGGALFGAALAAGWDLAPIGEGRAMAAIQEALRRPEEAGDGQGGAQR